MESTLGYRELSTRLIEHLTQRIRRGEMSERALSRLAGYSQPHIHNVLKGARGLTPEMADRLLHLLGIPFLSLLTQDELSGVASPTAVDFCAVPVLAGRLGAGKSFPETSGSPIRYFLPAHLAEAAVNPVVAQLDAAEISMSPLFEPGDRVLLDRSPSVRRRPQFESVYALCWRHRGFLARCRIVGGALVVVTDNPHSNVVIPDRIVLTGQSVTDFIRGRIVWFSREL